ncbi:MAG: hypothetical protein GEV12_19910 [Micromonosporaceae bacterium]|nr:hypothetical protein [Micromonosporaceae bacterium]
MPTLSSFFAYDALQPGELGYHHIEHLVMDQQNAWLDGYALRMRDGLPLLVEEAGGRVDGYLMDFRDPGEGFSAVSAYASRKHYRWAQGGLEFRTDAGLRRASALLGRSPGSGSEIEHLNRWSSADDPVFAYGVPVAAAIARPWLDATNVAQPWEALFHLQAAYLLTWTAVERLAALRLGPDAEEPTALVRRLRDMDGWSNLFQRARVRTGNRKIFDSRDPQDAYKLDDDGKKAWDFWYAVRSNLSHRGKGARRDLEIVREGFIDVHDVLRLILLQHANGVARTWSRVDADGKQRDWLLRDLLVTSAAGSCLVHRG